MKPLIKWAGGKSTEIKYVEKILPNFDRYIEPFFGGGAVFFDLEPKKAVINDVSDELMTFYKLIKNGKAGNEFKKELDPKENYWFSINQRTFKERHYFYFMFICEDDDRILIIPSLTLKNMLDKTKLDIKEGKEFGRWHFIVDKKEDKYILRTQKGEEGIDITEYLNSFDRLK